MNSDLIISGGGRNVNLPDFIPDADRRDGLEHIGEFVRPPRARVCQALSKDLTHKFNEGDIVVLPQMEMLAAVKLNENGKPKHEKVDAGESFSFTPVFFWPEWVCWNPREVTNEPAIHERTVDKSNPLVAKCRNRDLWFEPHPTVPEYQRRNVEHLNFLIVPHDGMFIGVPMVVSFSRSEHKAGSQFCALLAMRKGPIYACNFRGSVGYRENESGAWYGIDVVNPEEEPFVQSKELYDYFKAMHQEFKSAHDVELLVVDHEGSDEAAVGGSTGEF